MSEHHRPSSPSPIVGPRGRWPRCSCSPPPARRDAAHRRLSRETGEARPRATSPFLGRRGGRGRRHRPRGRAGRRAGPPRAAARELEPPSAAAAGAATSRPTPRPRRHPPPVLQPRASSPCSASASPASAPRCSPSCGPALTGGFGSKITRRQARGHPRPDPRHPRAVLRPRGPLLPQPLSRRTASRRPRRPTPPAVLAGHGGRRRRALPEVRAPRLPGAVVQDVAVVRVPAATARSTTGSARRRAARRPGASTASRSTVERRHVSVDTGARDPGPAHRHQHHRPGGRGPALRQRRRGLSTEHLARSPRRRHGTGPGHHRPAGDRHRRRLLVVRRLGPLPPRQHPPGQARGRLRDRAGAQPQAVPRRRGARGPRLDRALTLGPGLAGHHRRRPARCTGWPSPAASRAADRRTSSETFVGPRRRGAVRRHRRGRLQLRRLPRRRRGLGGEVPYTLTEPSSTRTASPCSTTTGARDHAPPGAVEGAGAQHRAAALHRRAAPRRSSPTAARSRPCRRGASRAAAP